VRRGCKEEAAQRGFQGARGDGGTDLSEALKQFRSDLFTERMNRELAVCVELGM
jgi:hypothetical protein